MALLPTWSVKRLTLLPGDILTVTARGKPDEFPLTHRRVDAAEPGFRHHASTSQPP
jgi:hypothetical protein